MSRILFSLCCLVVAFSYSDWIHWIHISASSNNDADTSNVYDRMFPRRNLFQKDQRIPLSSNPTKPRSTLRGRFIVVRKIQQHAQDDSKSSVVHSSMRGRRTISRNRRDWRGEGILFWLNCDQAKYKASNTNMSIILQVGVILCRLQQKSQSCPLGQSPKHTATLERWGRCSHQPAKQPKHFW